MLMTHSEDCKFLLEKHLSDQLHRRDALPRLACINFVEGWSAVETFGINRINQKNVNVLCSEVEHFML